MFGRTIRQPATQLWALRLEGQVVEGALMLVQRLLDAGEFLRVSGLAAMRFSSWSRCSSLLALNSSKLRNIESKWRLTSAAVEAAP